MNSLPERTRSCARWKRSRKWLAGIKLRSRVDVMANVFEGLVQFGERAEIRPAVAERWDISPDGRVYTFYLRESARFHNGRPVRSGPFRVVEPVLGKEVLLERFSNYWNPELPYVDRLSVYFGLTAEEILEAFLRGELDYVTDLPLTNLSELKER